jgi:transcriptional regulator of NAD metabolism
MLRAISVELLADVREKVRQHAGEVQAVGTPIVSVRDGYTVVDIPVSLEREDGVGRVVLDADRQVAGFIVRPAEAMR